MQCLVTGLKPWQFVDSETGELRNGHTLTYLEEGIEEDGERGYFELKESVSAEMLQKLTEVPGVYNFIYKKTRIKQKTGVRLVDLELVKPYTFEF